MKKLKELPEIKFNKSNDYIREKTLICITKEPIEIAYIVLDKDRVSPSRQNHKQKIYNFITSHLMCGLPYENTTKFKLIVDKRISNKVVRTDFDRYVREKTGFKVDISHEKSEYNKCLQATDFIAGAIFRKYESGDCRFYDLIKDRIKISEHYWDKTVWLELILIRRRANPVYLDPCTSRYITISTGLTRLVNILIQRIFNIYCSQPRPAPG